MLYWMIPLSLLAALVFIVLLTSAICFFKIFYSPRRKGSEELPLPEGDIYKPYHPQMIRWINEIRALPRKDVEIRSYDGLLLRGKYYEKDKGLPVEILFHGYKGSAERDLCGAVYRCFELGHNALIVDQRGAGSSEGHVVTFGVKESRDCLRWIDLVLNDIDGDVKIIITGLSMGAATVMTAAGYVLPKNVIGVLADCGYTSPRDIIKKVMKDMGLPEDILYPFARLGAILFGGFDPDSASPIESMKRCHLPVIFFHGDADSYVPCYMSKQNYEACAAEYKRLVITEGVEHGLCFPAAMDLYFKEARAFFSPLIK